MDIGVTLRAQIVAGLIAGLIGAVTIEICLIGAQVVDGAPPASIASSFAFIAVTLLGPGAYANPAAVPIGAVMHLIVSIGWAFGYVYLVRTQPQLLIRPILSGGVFGIVVWVCMQIVLITAGQYHRAANPRTLTVQLLAHIVFFGVPVALVVSSMLRHAAGPLRSERLR